MEPVQQLLSAVSTAATLKEWIESGGVADVISQQSAIAARARWPKVGDLSAVHAAMTQVKTAQDPRGQVGIGVDRLIDEHRMLKGIHGGGNTTRFIGHVYNRAVVAANVDQWVLCLAATCQVYLDVSTSWMSLLDEARYPGVADSWLVREFWLPFDLIQTLTASPFHAGYPYEIVSHDDYVALHAGLSGIASP